jgi:hypothetical protein
MSLTARAGSSSSHVHLTKMRRRAKLRRISLDEQQHSQQLPCAAERVGVGFRRRLSPGEARVTSSRSVNRSVYL